MSELSALISLAGMNNTYWTTFFAVTGAILGYQISGKRFSRLNTTKLLLSLVFGCFAYSSFMVIDSTDEARRALLTGVPKFPETTSALMIAPSASAAVATHIARAAWMLNPGPRCLVQTAHILLDLLVFSGIWLLPLYVKPEEQGTKPFDPAEAPKNAA